MAEAGYDLEHKPNVKEMLIGFIAGAKVPVQTRVDKPGWQSESVYVLPDEVIQPHGGAVERLHFAATSNGIAEYGTAGTLEAWQKNIGRYCVDNSRLVLGVCAGFAGPLLKPTMNEVGGLHLCGASSVGKSSALAVAGSVCGGGGGGYVRQWRATSNGLEGVAEGHNDGLLILDELGQVSPRDAAPAVYMLANGKGKSRASKEGNAVAAKNWRLMVLSSGELTLAAHTNDGGGVKVKAGAELRL